MSGIKIADGYVDVGLEDNTERDLDRILAKIRAAGKREGIPVGVDDQTARPLRDIDAKLKTWTAAHSQSVKITADTAGVERAALSARRTALSAKDAAERAAVAQKAAAEAADKLARGEIKEAEAAKLAADAERQTERAAIAAAAARRAAADAADKAADNYRQVARDAELAAAAERLGALKSSGQVKEHNALLGRLKTTYGDLSKTAVGGFTEIETLGTRVASSTEEMTQGFSVLGASGPAAIGLVVAALAAVPFAAVAATSAISLGLGGALAGLGLMATKGDAQVQAALHNMESHVKAEAAQVAAPFKKTWIEIADTAQSTFHALAPELRADFAELAPAVSRFVHDAGAAVVQLQPAFHAVTNAADALMAELGSKLPQISANVGHSIQIMADAAAKSAPAFANMMVAASQLLPPLAEMISLAAELGPAVSPFFDLVSHGVIDLSAFTGSLSLLTGGLHGSSHGFDTAAGSFDSFQAQAIKTASSTGQLVSEMDLAKLSAQEMSAAFDQLAGKTLGEREAMVQYREAISAMNKALKDNGAAHGFATDKGAKNEQALDQLAIAAQKAAAAMKDNGAGADQVAKFMESARQRIIRAAEGMHYTRAEAEALANKLLGIKPPPPIKLSMDDADFMVKLHKAQGLKLDPITGLLKGNNADYYNKWLQSKNLKIDPKTGLFKGNNADYYNKWLQANHLKIDPKTGVIKGNTSAFWNSVHSIPSVIATRTIAVRYAAIAGALVGAGAGGATGGRYDGKRFRYADGGEVSGLIQGPGTGTSDDIPAPWLSNNEFVVKERITRKNLAALTALNQGMSWLEAAKYADRGGYADGGPVRMRYASGGRVRLTPAQRAAQAAARKRASARAAAARKAAAAKKAKQTAGQGLINSIENHLLSSLSSIQSVANKVNDTIKKYFSGKTESKMLSWAKSIEAQWESAASKLATLNDRIKQAREYAAQTKTTMVGTADLSNLGTLGNARDISSGLAYKLSAMSGFSSKLGQLIKLGLNKNVLSQIINAGPEQGSAIADMLLRDTAQIKTINAEESQIDKIAGAIGNTAANVEYDYGKQAGKGFLSGLYGQQKELENLMRHLGEKLADGLKGDFGLPTSHKSSGLTWKKVKKHAAGGIASAGELALVGEAGPELITVGQSSRVYTAGQTAAMLAGGVHIEGGLHVHLEGTWDLTDPKAAKRAAAQLGPAMVDTIRRLDRAHK